MATFIMLSSLTDEGAKRLKANPERVHEVNREVAELGVTVQAQYAVLGQYDFVSVIEAPDAAAIARMSAVLAARGSIKAVTLAAIPIDDFIASLR